MKKIFMPASIILLAIPGLLFSQKGQSGATEKILSIMRAQEDSWNAGNLEGFMKGYWESDSLKFIGKSGITYGWRATLERYRKGYPDKAAMGKLTFTILHADHLSKNTVSVVGAWLLERESDSPSGYFSLIWRKIKGEWVIVADHSS